MENDQKYLTENREKFNNDLLDFISIPSIAALPEHSKDVQRAAAWLKERMLKAGIENVELMDTGGQPAVYGDWLHAGSDKPTVLIYGHYDVQPVDPLELWDIDPFKPIIKANKILKSFIGIPLSSSPKWVKTLQFGFKSLSFGISPP